MPLFHFIALKALCAELSRLGCVFSQAKAVHAHRHRQAGALPFFTANVFARVGVLFTRGVESRNFSERFRNLRAFSLVLLNKASLQCGAAMASAGKHCNYVFRDSVVLMLRLMEALADLSTRIRLV